MADGNVLSVLLGSAGSTATKYGNEVKSDKQTEKANALQAYMTMLQTQEHQMAQEQHRMAMLKGAANLKQADLDIKLGNMKLNALANPEGAIDEFKKNLGQIDFNQLSNIQVPMGGDLKFNLPGVGELNLSNKPPTTKSRNGDEIMLDILGEQGYVDYKKTGKITPKSMSAENQFIYSYLKNADPEMADEKFFNIITQSKTNTPDAIAVRLITTLGGGALDAFDMSDPEERAALAEVVQTVVKSVTGQDYDLSKIGDTLSGE